MTNGRRKCRYSLKSAASNGFDLIFVKLVQLFVGNLARDSCVFAALFKNLFVCLLSAPSHDPRQKVSEIGHLAVIVFLGVIDSKLLQP